MATDPRLFYGFEEEDRHFLTLPGDNSLNYPTFSMQGHGGTTGQSTSIGLAAALVNTGNTGTGAPTVPECGLGAAGGQLLGKIKVVEDDQSVTVQDRGYMLLPFVTGANVPVIGNAVGVDGTGNVQNVATYTGAKCVGFQPDPRSGTMMCVVKIG